MFLPFYLFPRCPTLEVIRESAVNSVVLPWCAMVDLMVVHMVLAGGGTVTRHQIILLHPVLLCSVLRIAMLHHQDAPSTCWCGVVGEVR